MTTERAIEILNPNHREHYDNIETVNEACRMGMQALEKQIPKQPIKSNRKIRYCEVFYCPTCNFEISGRIARFCYKCGQALDWSNK